MHTSFWTCVSFETLGTDQMPQNCCNIRLLTARFVVPLISDHLATAVARLTLLCCLFCVDRFKQLEHRAPKLGVLC